jgi:hypothetical protein
MEAELRERAMKLSRCDFVASNTTLCCCRYRKVYSFFTSIIVAAVQEHGGAAMPLLRGIQALNALGCSSRCWTFGFNASEVRNTLLTVSQSESSVHINQIDVDRVSLAAHSTPKQHSEVKFLFFASILTHYPIINVRHKNLIVQQLHHRHHAHHVFDRRDFC